MSQETDRFDIQTRITVGNAGMVYRAIDRQTGQPVAVKLLSGANLPAPFDAASLRADVPELLRIGGPHVLTLIAAMDDEDGMVLAYPWAEGTPGPLVPAARPLGPGEARQLAAQFVTALECAERHNCPHGDIRPSHIVVGASEGTPWLWLLDWGLSIHRATQPPEFLPFTAPERLAGVQPTLAADFFSVGASLYFLLTGRAPAAGADPATLATFWRQAQPAPLATLRPDLPPAFASWVHALLNPAPERRPQSTLAARSLLEGRPIPIAAIIEPDAGKPLPVAVPVRAPATAGPPATPSTPPTTQQPARSPQRPPEARPARSKSSPWPLVLVLASATALGGGLWFFRSALTDAVRSFTSAASRVAGAGESGAWTGSDDDASSLPSDPPGAALVLDGTDKAYAEVTLSKLQPPKVDHPIDGALTIESWVKLEEGIDANDGILAVERKLDISFADGHPRVRAGNKDIVVAKGTITPGRWMHVATVRDETGIWKLYLDGKPDGTATEPDRHTVDELRIGGTLAGGGTKGMLAEFRIWMGERSPRQIKAHFARTIEADALGLVFHGLREATWGDLQSGAGVRRTQEVPWQEITK